MNIPFMQYKSFKKYESQVGNAAEQVAEDSCKEAILIERELTVERRESLEKLQ